MLYVQDINPDNLDAMLLRTAVRSIYFKKGHNNVSADSYDTLDKGLSVDYNPSNFGACNTVLCGIYVNSSNSSNGLNDLTVWVDTMSTNGAML